MRSIVFRLRPEVTQEQQRVALSTIGGWDAVHQAASFSPNAKDPEVRRLCFAYVKNDTDSDKVVSGLQQLPEVESASVAAERRLV